MSVHPVTTVAPAWTSTSIRLSVPVGMDSLELIVEKSISVKVNIFTVYKFNMISQWEVGQ